MARKPFRAVPLRAVANVPRGPARSSRWTGTWRISPIMVVLPLTVFAAVLLYGLPIGHRSTVPNSEIAPLAGLSEEELRQRVWPMTPEALDGAQPQVVSGPLASDGFRGASIDGETARFTTCSGPVRDNCVIDGDTFWYAGEKIRIADINTPEVSSPKCAREAALGARASERLLVLLNEGAFSLEAADRDRDSYGRLLRTVTRGGESVGAVLVREGLAEEWRGYRSGWC